MVATHIGRYRVLAKLGETGLSDVFKAEDEQLQRTVAIKVLRQSPTTTESHRSLLRREALAISRIDHPNVVTLYEVIEHDGTDCMVMQFVDGPTLRQELANGPLPVPRALRIAGEVAEALEAAHRLGVIHRDLKPENIVLTGAGTAKVLDFGLAHLAGSSTLQSGDALVGTIPYMAPEQVNADPVDERTDVYSLGAVLFEMLTGHLPHEAPDYAGLLNRILTAPAPRLRQLKPELPEDVERVVAQALERRAGDRYADAGAFVHDLRVLIARHPESRTDEALLARRRPRLRSAAVTAGAVVLLTALGWWIWTRIPGGESTPGPRIFVGRWESSVQDSRSEWLPSGVMDCMIRALGSCDGLSVISRETVRATLEATASDASIPRDGRVLAAARRLHARYLVTGTIEPEGPGLRIACDLSDVSRGTLVRTWSHSLPGLGEEFYTTIDELAAAVASTVGAGHGHAGGAGTALASELTSSMNALRLYHIGLQRSETGDEPGALEALRRSVAADSTFADAQLLLAQLTPGDAEQKRALAAAMAARGRASPVTRELVEAMDFERRGRWTDAEARLRSALALDPENVQAGRSLAQLQMMRRRFEDAAAEYATLRQTSPDDHSFDFAWSSAYLEIRRPARALAVVEEWRAAFPESEAPLRALAVTRYALGQYGEALALCDTLDRLRPGAGTTMRAHVLDELGRQREAGRLYASLATTRDDFLAPARSSSYLALQCYEAGRYAEGLPEIERALRAEPSTYNEWLGGVLAAGAGDLVRAARHAASIARHFDATEDSTLVEAYGNRRLYYHLLGRIAIAGGDTLNGLSLLERAVRFSGRLDGKFFRTDLGRARLSARDPAGAAREFEQVLLVQSNAPLALLGLGEAKLALGDRAAARAPLEQLHTLWEDADADYPPALELQRALRAVRSPPGAARR